MRATGATTPVFTITQAGRYLPGLLLGLILALGSTRAMATDLVIIANPDLDPGVISRSDLGNIFRRKLRLAATGQVLVPVNLPVSHPLRQAFTRQVLGRSPQSMLDYWNEAYFHGISPPYVLASQEAMIRFISETPGAIGYVLDCHLDKRVRILFRLPLAVTPPQPACAR